MNRLRLILAFAVTLAGSLAHGVELTSGLVYLRPGVSHPPAAESVVIDLRQVTDEEATPLLAALEPGRNNPKRLVLALVSPETSDGVRRQLATLPRCLTVGRNAADFKTDIVVTASAEADRRAIEALAAGTSPDKLLVENADKPRYDETTLVRAHSGETEATATKPQAPPSTPPTAELAPAPVAEPAPASPPIFDAVLQRAVHLYRGLVVLKRT